MVLYAIEAHAYELARRTAYITLDICPTTANSQGIAEDQMYQMHHKSACAYDWDCLFVLN